MGALVTVKDCISAASMEIGIAQKPISTAVGTNDQDIAQMLALLSAVAREVLSEEPYRTTLGDGLWIYSAAGVPKPKIDSDDDVIAFDADLAITGLKYRFLKAKGLEFGEELRDFTTLLNKLAVRANARVLDLDEAAGADDGGGSPWGYPATSGGRQQ